MKKALAILLVLVLFASLSVTAFADRYVANYFKTPVGYETMNDAKTVARLQHKDTGAYGDTMFAYFDSLKDAFDNLAYTEQHDEIYLFKSDDTDLKFPLYELGQDFYLVIEKDSKVEYTGEVSAQPYFVVATIEDCAEEINLDPAVYDVTHYIVVAYAPPAGGNYNNNGGSNGNGNNNGNNSSNNNNNNNNNNSNNNNNNNNNNNDDNKETKPAYTGELTVDKNFWILPGKNVSIRWMLPTGPNEDGSYDAPGLAITYDKFADNGTIVVGNPEVANEKPISGINQEFQDGATTVGISAGTSEVPVEQKPSEVAVDVNDGPEHTDVTVGGETTPENPIPFSFHHKNETADMVLGILGALLQNLG